MPIYELHAADPKDGSSKADWFDDKTYTWNDKRLANDFSIQDDWTAPTLFTEPTVTAPSPVLYNPRAFAFSKDVAAKIGDTKEIEFLPIRIGTLEYFIMHVLPCIAIPNGCVVERVIGGNVLVVKGFPRSFEIENEFFRLRQPNDSVGADGTPGYLPLIYMNSVGREKIERACEGLLYGKEL